MFPIAAMAFYRDLEASNTREFWQGSATRYEADVRVPVREVAALLEPEFGKLKLFRPNRDVRFSADKSPYKTHQGVYGARSKACGFYFEVNGYECLVAGGNYDMSALTLARFRSAVADRHSGAELEGIVAALEADGWTREGRTLKTAPRGYPKDHPRIALLRHQTLSTSCEVTAEGIEAFAAEVAQAWRRVAPLVDWLAARVVDDA